MSTGRGEEKEGRVNEGEKEGRKEFGPPNLHHISTPLFLTVVAGILTVLYDILLNRRQNDVSIYVSLNI